jgi:hypothetical protein
MSRKTLAITHLLGNAILLWLAYYWLGVGESTISRLIWSALLAVLMLAAAVWLHGSGFSDFKTALQNLLPLCVFAIIVLTFYGVLAWWKDYSSAPAFKIASYITLKLRKPLKPATVQTIFNGILWLVRWWILPSYLLPSAAKVASDGWQGYRRFQASIRWLYWIEVIALLLAGIWLPLKLIVWVPALTSFSMQMMSFIIRAAVAYLLFVTSCLLLEHFSASAALTHAPSAPVPSPKHPAAPDSQPAHAAAHDEASNQTPRDS